MTQTWHRLLINSRFSLESLGCCCRFRISLSRGIRRLCPLVCQEPEGACEVWCHRTGKTVQLAGLPCLYSIFLENLGNTDQGCTTTSAHASQLKANRINSTQSKERKIIRQMSSYQQEKPQLVLQMCQFYYYLGFSSLL